MGGTKINSKTEALISMKTILHFLSQLANSFSEIALGHSTRPLKKTFKIVKFPYEFSSIAYLLQSTYRPSMNIRGPMKTSEYLREPMKISKNLKRLQRTSEDLKEPQRTKENLRGPPKRTSEIFKEPQRTSAQKTSEDLRVTCKTLWISFDTNLGEK